MGKSVRKPGGCLDVAPHPGGSEKVKRVSCRAASDKRRMPACGKWQVTLTAIAKTVNPRSSRRSVVHRVERERFR